MSQALPIKAGQEAHALRPKTTLTEAAHLLAELMERIDNGEDLGEVLVAAFHDTRLDLAQAVDRRIAFAHWVKGAIAMAKEQRDEWRQKVQQLEMLEDRFKANTQAAIEENPDIPFVGSMGKISVQKNPPSLKLAFEGKSLTPDMVECFQIPKQYVVTKVTYELDTAQLKTDILAGDTRVPWAWIEQGQSVRFKK